MARTTKKTAVILASAALVLVGGGVAVAAVAMSGSSTPTASPTPSAETMPRSMALSLPEKRATVPVTNVARVGIDGWNLADRNTVGAVLPEVGNAANGAVSLRVDAPASDVEIIAASVPLSLDPALNYTLSASVRVLSPDKMASGVQLAIGSERYDLPELDADWERVEFPVTVPADQAPDTALSVVLGGAVRGFGIDDIVVVAAGGENAVANGSFEQVQAPPGILNDSLVFTRTSALLAVSAAAGDVTWTATSSAGGEAISGTAVAGGPITGVPLDTVPQGHYEVSVRDSAGFQATTNVAIIEDEPFYVEQDARFGVGAHVEKEPFIGTGTMAAALGFAEVRNDISWQRNEKIRGIYNWDENYVREFTRLHANGVKLLGIVAYGNELYGSKRAPSNEQSIQAYAKYSKAVADTFDMVGLEVLNEFNHRETDLACGKAPSCYLPIAEAARAEVKAAHPDLPIVTGSTALYDGAWFTGFWQAGGMAATDVVSYHPYEAWIDRDADLIAGTVQQSYADMREHAGDTRPVWISEMGFPTHYDGVGLLEQGEMLVRNQTLAFANGVEKYFWYDLVNDTPDPAAGEANFGLYEHAPRAGVLARAPKPGAFAQALLIAQLGGKEHTTTESDEALLVEVFGEGADETRVAWSPAGETEWTFPSDSLVTVTNLAGHAEAITPVDGSITITLGASPVFVSSPGNLSAVK